MTRGGDEGDEGDEDKDGGREHQQGGRGEFGRQLPVVTLSVTAGRGAALANCLIDTYSGHEKDSD